MSLHVGHREISNGSSSGAGATGLRAQVLAALDGAALGAKLAKAPNLHGLKAVFVDDKRMVDGSRRDAYVDAKKQQFYLKVTGSGMGGPQTIGPFWYGPLSLKPSNGAGSVSTATLISLRGATAKALASGKLQWKSLPKGRPLGVKMLTVPLYTEHHPDGFSYCALIPVGALAPGALTKDPNKVDSFYIQRTGGFAGITQIAGPVSRGKAGN